MVVNWDSVVLDVVQTKQELCKDDPKFRHRRNKNKIVIPPPHLKGGSKEVNTSRRNRSNRFISICRFTV